ncbi:MAG: DegT/DnrJ/EryC1/StrS family aminotransferase, partial [Chloroflexota bacterium]
MVDSFQIIPHSRPSIGTAEKSAVLNVIESGFVNTGKWTESFEQAFAQMQMAQKAFAVNSGTLALELVLRAQGVKSGGTVLFPAYVCASIPQAIINVGAQPVAVDIEPSTLGFSLASCQRIYGNLQKQGRTIDVIILAHPFGIALDVDGFLRMGIPII